MDKAKLHTPDFTEANIEKLAELFPGCVVEAYEDDPQIAQMGADTNQNKNDLRKSASSADKRIRYKIDFDQLRQELSGNIVEGPQERYRLDWPGKREALLAANAPIAKTLRPARDESVDFDTTQNLFIEGDNLDALKLLQETYLGKVKMIYIDPPYNTGNDFIYDDDFVEDSETYFERSNQKGESGERLVTNSDSNGRFHSDWMSMIYSRIKLVRNLLTDDGALFISIDQNEVTNLTKACDEIFGETNRIGHISIVSNLKGRSDDKYYATAHNYLLVYQKSSFDSLGLSLPDEYLKDYTEADDKGRNYRLQGLRKRGDSARRIDRPNMFYPFYVNPDSNLISLEEQDGFTEVVYPYLSDGEEGRWRWGKDTARERLNELTCKPVGSSSRLDIFQIDYAEGVDGEKRVKPKTFWNGAEFANETGSLEVKKLFGKSYFDTPKPLGLIKKCLEHSTKDNDIVLDFFAGSSTTAHAVMQLNTEDGGNRRFIMVQLPEACDEKSEAFKAGYSTIAEISKERIHRAGTKIKEENATTTAKLDTGFRVLKVDTSNVRDIYYTPDTVKQDELALHVDHIKEDRSAEDLLFQMMLDWGVDLSLPIQRKVIYPQMLADERRLAHEAEDEINGKSNLRESVQSADKTKGYEVFFVDENAIAACFETGINEDFIKELAKRQPMRAVFRDSGFANDAVKINVGEVFKLLSPTTELKTL